MKRITSAENNFIKTCVKLSQKKYRRRTGCFIVEGENLTLEAIQSGRAEYVLLSTAYKKSKGQAAGAIGAQPGDGIGGCDAVILDEALFAKISQTKTNQGIMAVVRMKEYTEDEFLRRINSPANVLVLDRVQDQGNIGTMIRTAEAAGYRGILTITGTGDPYSPKAIRAAAGSVLRMPIYEAKDARNAVRLLEKAGKHILGTLPEGESEFYDEDMSRDTALVIGNEGNGMSDEMKSLVHKNITIPMAGNAESLNAAVAAGILMYTSMKERC